MTAWEGAPPQCCAGGGNSEVLGSSGGFVFVLMPFSWCVVCFPPDLAAIAWSAACKWVSALEWECAFLH